MERKEISFLCLKATSCLLRKKSSVLCSSNRTFSNHFCEICEKNEEKYKTKKCFKIFEKRGFDSWSPWPSSITSLPSKCWEIGCKSISFSIWKFRIQNLLRDSPKNRGPYTRAYLADVVRMQRFFEERGSQKEVNLKGFFFLEQSFYNVGKVLE